MVGWCEESYKCVHLVMRGVCTTLSGEVFSSYSVGAVGTRVHSTRVG